MKTEQTPSKIWVSPTLSARQIEYAQTRLGRAAIEWFKKIVKGTLEK